MGKNQVKNNYNKLYELLKIKIGERIRDMVFKEKKIYLFLEDTASIGIIEL